MTLKAAAFGFSLASAWEGTGERQVWGAQGKGLLYSEASEGTQNPEAVHPALHWALLH